MVSISQLMSEFFNIEYYNDLLQAYNTASVCLTEGDLLLDDGNTYPWKRIGWQANTLKDNSISLDNLRVDYKAAGDCIEQVKVDFSSQLQRGSTPVASELAATANKAMQLEKTKLVQTGNSVLDHIGKYRFRYFTVKF